MLQRALPNRWIRIAERTVLVFLTLKEVRIDRARQNSITFGELPDIAGAIDAHGAVPQDVQSYGRTYTRQQVHLPGIAELLLGGGGGGRLDKFSEARAGIGEAPRRYLDAEGLKRAENPLGLACVHRVLSLWHRRLTILAATGHAFFSGNRAFRIAEHHATAGAWGKASRRVRHWVYGETRGAGRAGRIMHQFRVAEPV